MALITPDPPSAPAPQVGHRHGIGLGAGDISPVRRAAQQVGSGRAGHDSAPAYRYAGAPSQPVALALPSSGNGEPRIAPMCRARLPRRTFQQARSRLPGWYPPAKHPAARRRAAMWPATMTLPKARRLISYTRFARTDCSATGSRFLPKDGQDQARRPGNTRLALAVITMMGGGSAPSTPCSHLAPSGCSAVAVSSCSSSAYSSASSPSGDLVRVAEHRVRCRPYGRFPGVRHVVTSSVRPVQWSVAHTTRVPRRFAPPQRSGPVSACTMSSPWGLSSFLRVRHGPPMSSTSTRTDPADNSQRTRKDPPFDLVCRIELDASSSAMRTRSSAAGHAPK